MTVEQIALGVGFLFLLIATYGWSYWYGHYCGEKKGFNDGWARKDDNTRGLIFKHDSHIRSLEDEIEFLRDALLDDDLVLTKFSDHTEEENDDE